MTHSRIGCRQVAATAAIFCVLFATSAFGASTADEEAYQRALDGMLADIGDSQRSFDFVEAATDVGDLRGAVASLERMLLINPGLANIELELGVLYLRLGNPELGRYHINRALRAPNVPRVVRQRAEAILATTGGQRGRSFWRGFIGFSGRHDGNVSASPSTPDVLVLSVPGTLSSLEESDTSYDLTLGVTHVYAFAGSAGHSFETNLLAYASRYDEFSSQDLLVGALDTGPAFRVGGSADAPWLLRPYFAARESQLDGDSYLSSVGGGLELRAHPSVRTYGFLRLDYSNQEFDDSALRFFSDRSGDYTTATVGLTHQFGQRFQLSASLTGDEADADRDYQSFSRFGGDVGAKLFFGHGAERPPWSIGLSVMVREIEYDAADPQVSIFVVRDDSRVDTALTIDIPVSRSSLISLRWRHTENDSNIPNYEFENDGGGLGFSWRF